MIASSSSRNSSKNMPRFSSNDMVHNHYLDVAKKKIQERDRNSTTSVPTSARIQTTTDDSKPNPRSNNQTSRSLPVSKSSRVTITAVPKADHSKKHSVATLRKENETLKQHYKDLYDSIKITRSKTTEQTTSLLANNAELKAQILILGKPVLPSLRNQSVVRQPNAFKSERAQMSKQRFASQVDVNKNLSKPVTQHYLPKKTESAFAKPNHVIAFSSSRNSSKNMPRFSSNDMVHNHYLDEARKKTQERDRNSKTSMMPSARFQCTTDDSKPKPRSNNQTSRSLPVSKSSRVTIMAVPKADHSKSSSSFSDSKQFVCSTCHKCVFNANHDACITKLLKEVNSHAKIQSHKTRNSNKPVDQKSHTQKPGRQIFTGHRFSPNKTSAVYEKTSPRSDLRSKTTEQTTSLLANNAELKAQIQEKVFAIAALKNDLRKLKGNSVDTKFDKTSVLGKPVLQSPRNQSVVRQPNAFKSERPQMSKQRFASQVDVNNNLSKPVTQHYLPKKRESVFAKPDHMIASSESRNSSKNMPRFSSNDMVHNHYLDEARKKTQERDRNSKTSVMHSARFQSTADDSKPKPRNNNQTPRSLLVSKSSCVTITTVPKIDHSKSSSSFSDSKNFVCWTCHKCVFNANHDACITKLLKEVNSRAKIQSQKTRNMYEKTSHRSDLRWKTTGKFFKYVGLRWIPTGKLFDSCTSKVDSEPPHGSYVDIPNIHECKQTLDVSAGTSINVQKEQHLDLSADTLCNVNKENIRFFVVTAADASVKRQQQPDSTSSTSTLATSVTADRNFDL
ncbi:hypothetical protein Tco_1013547 [Tanacetum coccineum]